MSERNLKLFIEDILSSINKIEKYCRNIDSFEEFLKEDIVIDATLRNLELVGEAAKNIPESIRERYPEIPWKRVIGLRNIIIHGYFSVDLSIVWTIITRQLPKLKETLKKMKEEL